MGGSPAKRAAAVRGPSPGPLPRLGSPRQARFDRLQQAPEQLLEAGQHALAAVLELAVEAGGGDAGALGDLGDRGLGVAALAADLGHRRDQSFALVALDQLRRQAVRPRRQTPQPLTLQLRVSVLASVRSSAKVIEARAKGKVAAVKPLGALQAALR